MDGDVPAVVVSLHLALVVLHSGTAPSGDRLAVQVGFNLACDLHVLFISSIHLSKVFHLMLPTTSHWVLTVGKSTSFSTIEHSSQVTGVHFSVPAHTLFPLASTSQSVRQLFFVTCLHSGSFFLCFTASFTSSQSLMAKSW